MTTSEHPQSASVGPGATGGDATATSGEPEAQLEQPKPSGEERKPKHRGVMQSLTALCVRYVERLMPDPYLFAVILTLIVAALVALLVNGASPSGMLKAWYGGVWGSQNIFTFAFQMVLILVTGYTLAEAPVLKRAIVYVASKPRNQVQGALLCFGVSAVLSLLNWGLGLVAGALVARQVAKRFTDAHFGYLIAAAFMGFIVWTQGLSSSIALANTDNGSPINVIHKMTGITVPLKLTIFQPYSWLSVIVVLALLALAIWRMEPAQSLAPDPAVFEDEDQAEVKAEGKKTFAEWLEDLWILNILVFAAGIAYFCISGFALNISSMIMLFTITSALLHRTPIRFIRAFTGAAKVSGPLLLQYPLYGGLVGLAGLSALASGHRGQAAADAAGPGGRERRDAVHAAVPDLHRLIDHQPVRAVRRWALGRAGPDRGRLGAGDGSAIAGLSRVDLHGGRRRRGGREHDPTVLVAAPACDRETQCPSGDGLYDRRIRDRVGGVGCHRSDRALRNLTSARAGCYSGSLTASKALVHPSQRLVEDLHLFAALFVGWLDGAAGTFGLHSGRTLASQQAEVLLACLPEPALQFLQRLLIHARQSAGMSRVDQRVFLLGQVHMVVASPLIHILTGRTVRRIAGRQVESSRRGQLTFTSMRLHAGLANRMWRTQGEVEDKGVHVDCEARPGWS